MKILITGGAGFIGSNIAKKLMDRGDKVVLLDNFNDYYDPRPPKRPTSSLRMPIITFTA